MTRPGGTRRRLPLCPFCLLEVYLPADWPLWWTNLHWDVMQYEGALYD